MRRTNRRTPLVFNDRRHKAVVKDNLSSENSVTACKKSCVDSSQCSDGNVAVTECDADKPCSVAQSGCGDLTGRECTSSRDNPSGDGFGISHVVSESDNFSPGQLQYPSSHVDRAVSDNAVHVVDMSQEDEDRWWNKVDSHTWLQGVQSYLLLHSAVDTPELRQVPVTVPNVSPLSVMANHATSHLSSTLPAAATASAAAERNSLFTQPQYDAQPLLAPVTGYRVLPNGVLSAVPVYYFPVVNYNECKLSMAASSVESQQTDADVCQSTVAAAVDLVSFMHNYCLPPSTLPQSSAALQTTHSATDQSRFASAPIVLSHNGPDALLSTRAGSAKSDIQSLSAVAENSHSGSWPTMSASSHSDVVGYLSNSSVCLTPRSMSSCSSGESWNDEASELTSCFSTVAVTAADSNGNINNCNLLSADTDLTIPGWFGKGLGIRRLKRRLSRQS